MNASFRYCRSLAKQSGSNFIFTFHLLPRSQHEAMFVLYAFMRITDDLADAEGDVSIKRESLAQWRQQLDDALAGRDSHPIHPALRSIVRKFGIPVRHLHEVIDGVEMDLEPLRFATFDELYGYCYRVASAVGLCCIPIWGYHGERATEYAEYAGIAFQLTNILRDLGEDLERGRVYLPTDDLVRFGSDPNSWKERRTEAAFQSMMRFQVERAKRYYQFSEPLMRYLSPTGRAIFGVMSSVYRELLNGVQARNYDVFSERVRVSKWRKMTLLMRALPMRWGW